jgi:hypothetical protein
MVGENSTGSTVPRRSRVILYPRPKFRGTISYTTAFEPETPELGWTGRLLGVHDTDIEFGDAEEYFDPEHRARTAVGTAVGTTIGGAALTGITNYVFGSAGENPSFTTMARTKRRRSGSGRSRKRSKYDTIRRTGGYFPVRYRLAQPYRKQQYNQFLDSGMAVASDGTRWLIAQDAAAVTSMFSPAEGAGPDQRLGQKAYLKSLYIKGMCAFKDIAANAVNHPRKCRMILVLDKQANGAQATIGDVLNTGTTTTSNIQEKFMNMSNRYRFKNLWDKTMYINTNTHFNGTNTTQQGVGFKFEKYIRWKRPLKFNWDTTAAATTKDVTLCRDNNLFLIVAFEDVDLTTSPISTAVIPANAAICNFAYRLRWLNAY